MRKNVLDSNSDGKDSDFCALLREVLAGRKTVDELLWCLIFRRRLLGHCRVLTRNEDDAQELYNDVCLKVFQVLLTRFQPDFSKEFGSFFGWLRTVTLRIFIDRERKGKLAFGSERPEELLKADSRVDLQSQLEHNEGVERLVKCIMSQPREIRLAADLYVLQGFSSSETVEELAKLEIHITAPTVRNWVHDALKPFFPTAIAFSITELARKDNERAKGRPTSKVSRKESKVLDVELARKKNKLAKPPAGSAQKRAPKAKRKSPSAKG